MTDTDTESRAGAEPLPPPRIAVPAAVAVKPMVRDGVVPDPLPDEPLRIAVPAAVAVKPTVAGPAGFGAVFGGAACSAACCRAARAEPECRRRGPRPAPAGAEVVEFCEGSASLAGNPVGPNDPQRAPSASRSTPASAAASTSASSPSSRSRSARGAAT